MTPDGNGRVRVTEREDVMAREGIAPLEEQVERVETRVALRPIASPAILALFALGHASFIVGGWWANWYGTAASPTLFFPFVLIFGGIAQILAGMWSFRARDGLGAFMWTMWGSWWAAFGLLTWFLTTQAIAGFAVTGAELGMIFTALAAATWIGTIAAAYHSWALLLTLASLAAGATLLAIGGFTGVAGWVTIGGWLFVLTAVLAWYTAAARLFNTLSGRSVLPVGRTGRARRRPSLDAGLDEPGVAESW